MGVTTDFCINVNFNKLWSLTFSSSGTEWVGITTEYKLFEFNLHLLHILKTHIHFYSCLYWGQPYYEMDEVLVC